MIRSRLRSSSRTMLRSVMTGSGAVAMSFSRIGYIRLLRGATPSPISRLKSVQASGPFVVFL